MRKLFIIFIISVSLLIPSTAMALIIGDINFELVVFDEPLVIVEGTNGGYTKRVHPYPSKSIQVFHVLGTYYPMLTPFFALGEPGEEVDITVEIIKPTAPPVIDKCPVEIDIEPIEPPNDFTTIEGGIGHFLLYGLMDDSRPFVDALRFFIDLDIKRMVIEIHSSGGYSRVMQRIVGYMDSYRKNITLETRVYGIAMSAGFIVFLGGDERDMR